VNSAIQTEVAVVQGLREQIPVRDLPGVSIKDVQEQPEQPFDVSFELRSGANRVQVLGEIKPAFTPRLLEDIAPWIQRLKSLRTDVAVAVIAPALSSQAQAFCAQNGIDFIDLAGNVSINVPGKFTLQRLGMKSRESAPSSDSQRTINVFSGRSSRILRVLLEKPKTWSVTELARELGAESDRFENISPATRVRFEISLGSVSKAIASLEELLLVRRRGGDVIVPEPSRLLLQWAEKYKERYRWRLRSSFQVNNPFGQDLQNISVGIERFAPGTYAFSGAIAASIEAPFVDIEVVDIFLMQGEADVKLRPLKAQPSIGPKLRFVYPYDDGVFMYSKRIGKALVVSGVQAYLDLYARGGRDLKQAEVLLNETIQRRWGAA
jgi:DNA-binding transcriptional ArsR family regulator